MDKFKEVKSLLSNVEVVRRYLGTPIKHNSIGIWYKSPFRSERTASFYVSEKGIHDFGSSEHYDIISFVQRYFNTTPKRALEIICDDFGLNIGNEYENKAILENLKRKREEEKRAKEMLEKWFNNKLVSVCKKIQINKQCIETCKIVPIFEVLYILYDEQIQLEMYFEELLNANEQEKIKMYLEAKNDR